MNSLRNEILQYVEAAYLHALPVENLATGELEPPRDISEVEWIADSILNLVASKMPEKKHFVQYREFLVIDKKMPIEANQRQAQSYVQGYNLAIAEVKSILKGETDE